MPVCHIMSLKSLGIRNDTLNFNAKGREDYQEHFVWARTQNEAKIRVASLASKAPRAATSEAGSEEAG